MLHMVDQVHWHIRRGRQLLLAKVRMPIGRIGIFLFTVYMYIRNAGHCIMNMFDIVD